MENSYTIVLLSSLFVVLSVCVEIGKIVAAVGSIAPTAFYMCVHVHSYGSIYNCIQHAPPFLRNGVYSQS